MKSNFLMLLVFSLLLSACHISSHAEKKHDIKTFEKYPLVHLVYLKTKKDVNQADLIVEIRTIEAIDGLKNLEVGTFKDLGDQRAMSEYSILIQMRFADEVAYQVYQKHPIHLALKKKSCSLFGWASGDV